MPTLERRDVLRRHSYRGKRTLDVVVSLPLSLLAAPIILLCALVSAMVFRSWPFFTQEREGVEGRPFRLVKIRSLPTSVPRDLDRDELDVFPTSGWGRFIRERHLDELPQLLQVVSGAMSLVGPRPMITSICERMDPESRALRRSGRPGVTGLWQISEDGTRLVIEAMHHDERYLKNSSLRLDLKILLETARQVLGKRRMTEAEVREYLALDTSGSEPVVGRSRPTITATGLVRVVGYLALVVLQLVLAVMISESPKQVVPAVAACGLVLLLASRGAMLVLALPACFAATRIAPFGVELSVADAVLAALVVAALPFVDWSIRSIRYVVALGVAYLVMTAVNVFAVTTSQSLVEWVHRWFIVVGALVIGGAIAATGRTTTALRALVATATVFATVAVYQAIGSGFRPSYVFGFHKNFVGPLLAMTALVLLAGRVVLRIPPWSAAVTQVVLALGLLATQSRASIVGLVVGALVIFVRSGRLRWQTMVLMPVLVGLSFFVYASIRTNLTGANDTRFSPIRTRLTQYETAWEHFANSPVFGIGIRWFKTPGTFSDEPHSALFLTLSETGVWGLLATSSLFIGTWVVLRRSTGPLADAAIAVLAFRLVEGQIAIFWLAGTMTLPWLIVGLAAGTARNIDPELDDRDSEALPTTLSRSPV